MIIRTWRGTVRREDAEEYARYIRDTGFGEYGLTPGNRGAWMLRRDLGEETELITVSRWEDRGAIRAFAGEDIEASVLYDEDERFLTGTPTVAHYEVIDEIEPGEAAELIEINGVLTWCDAQGDGPPLVLMHPGGADSRAWDSNLPSLTQHFRVHRFDRRGQGRTPDVGGRITFDDMARDAAAFIERVVGGPAHVAGHSIGAPVGLLLAHQRPDLVGGLVFSEGVFHHDGWKDGVLDPLPSDVEEFLGGLYGEVSPHGPEHWPGVWKRLDSEHHRAPSLTTEELGEIATPTLLMFADNESEVRLDHIHAMHDSLPDAQLAILPDTGHGLPADKPEIFGLLVAEFLSLPRVALEPGS